jgi:integrase
MRGFLDELGFPPGLDLHSLRRSYVTHMQTEHGYDTKFISMQVGHEHTSTTTIYTLPSPDYAARELERVPSRRRHVTGEPSSGPLNRVTGKPETG